MKNFKQYLRQSIQNSVAAQKLNEEGEYTPRRGEVSAQVLPKDIFGRTDTAAFYSARDGASHEDLRAWIEKPENRNHPMINIARQTWHRQGDAIADFREDGSNIIYDRDAHPAGDPDGDFEIPHFPDQASLNVANLQAQAWLASREANDAAARLLEKHGPRIHPHIAAGIREHGSFENKSLLSTIENRQDQLERPYIENRQDQLERHWLTANRSMYKTIPRHPR